MKRVLLFLITCIIFTSVTAEEVRGMNSSSNLLNIDGYICNNMQYPLLEYADRTYISIRDMAFLFNKDVDWDGQKKTIYLTTPKNHRKDIISNESVAIRFAQAISEEWFPTKLTSNTIYKTEWIAIDEKYPLTVIVYIWFGGGDVSDMATSDCEITFDARSGACLNVIEKE